MNDRAPVLVIASPGRLRTSLGVLLRTGNQPHSIWYADDVSSALRLLDKIRPRLIVVDANLADGEVRVMLDHLNRRDLLSRCLALAHSEVQANRFQAGGVGQTLQIGFSTENFLETVARLMNDSSAEDLPG
jgi:DNA-binding NtrC family response regulator